MDQKATQRVQDLVDAQVAEGRQIGVQVAAYVHGERFLEVVAGTMGPGDERPMQHDSVSCVFSATKGIGALAIHQLADRGLLDYDEPVATYWPAFAQNGKERATVLQAVSHQVGLHAMPAPFRPEHVTDWAAGVARTEQGAPAWAPGTDCGYHAVTFGWLVGGIVESVTGRHAQEFIRAEIAEPLGVVDELYVGIPDDPAVLARCTTLDIVAAGEGMPIPDDAPFYEAMPKGMWPYFNDVAFRRACLPSGNGHFSARALARVYAALANGGQLDGAHLVTPERIEHMRTKTWDGPDRVLIVPVKRGIGFWLGGLGPDLEGNLVAGPMGPKETTFGHAGAGGSMGFADPETGLAVGVAVNKMAYPLPGQGTTQEICDLVRELAVRA
ncbi:MAG: serine hydrolase [Acidimicrobiia bacterium]|nr:serine hydrolase [Acidimicrobiia bacterium]